MKSGVTRRAIWAATAAACAIATMAAGQSRSSGSDLSDVLAGRLGAGETERLGRVHVMPVVLQPSGLKGAGGVAGGCPQEISTHTDSDFGPGEYIAQGGVAEGEIQAQSYVIPAGSFPIRIDQVETLFATSNASQSTTTEWSVLFWSGTPSTGTLVAEFSSDGTILPHLQMPPGTTGTIIQVSVDPGDPEQIFIDNNGSNTFSIGFRIDQHNDQTQDPCFVAPPTCCNAFPTTDLDGLDSASGNWIFAIDCGPFGCPSGWKTFAQLGLCQPSGDWVMRAFWTPFDCGTGACCLDSGSCVQLNEVECQIAGGDFQGLGVPCGDCPEPSVACCFEGGGCVQFPEDVCLNAGGISNGPGSECGEIVCFPMGACCLPDGSCIDDLSPEDCAALDGAFQGDDTTCAGTNCPAPVGACCFDTGFCFITEEANCTAANGTWFGPGSNCDDSDQNGTADVCEDDPGVPGDLDGDGDVDPADLATLLGAWGTADETADIDGDGVVGSSDLAILLANWG